MPYGENRRKEGRRRQYVIHGMSVFVVMRWGSRRIYIKDELCSTLNVGMPFHHFIFIALYPNIFMVEAMKKLGNYYIQTSPCLFSLISILLTEFSNHKCKIWMKEGQNVYDRNWVFWSVGAKSSCLPAHLSGGLSPHQGHQHKSMDTGNH